MIILLWALNMSIDGDTVRARDAEETTDITTIDSNLDVTGELTATLMRFGSDTCNIEIKNDDDGYPEMVITLPNTYRGKRVTQEYRMRSIIEAIQELNRRTATFGSDTTFDVAKSLFDTNDSDAYNQFACNDHEDGLPAASNGSVDAIDDLTDTFKIQIVQNETVIATTVDTYPLKDILQWDTFVASERFATFLSTNSIMAAGLTAPTMNSIDPVGNLVTVIYTPPN